MKAIIKNLLILCIFSLCVFGLTSCGGGYEDELGGSENKPTEGTDGPGVDHTCDFSGEWQFDSEFHWKTCECGEMDIENSGVHEGGTATTTQKAKCSVCGAEYGDLKSDDKVTEDEVTEEHTEEVTEDKVTEDVATEQTPSTQEVVTIKIMFHVDKNSAEGKAYKKRIDAFNLKYKNVYKASASFVARTTGASMYETDLINKQQEGTLPDIITFDAPNCASYAKSKLLYPLDALVPNSELSDFISVSRFENKIYGLPIQESSAGFFYNKQIFQKAGIDVSRYTVDNPWTFAEFEEVCRKLTEFSKNNSGYSKYAVDMRLDATKDETATYMLYSFIYAAGGEFVSEDGYTAQGYLNSPETIKGFEFLQGLVNKGYTGYDIGATDFFTGKVGMYLSSGWTIPDLDNKFREYFPDRNSWGILPYPKDVNACSATGSWCFGITNNGNEDKTGAKELLMWLTSAESSKTITDATGMIPARKSVATNYEVGSPEYVLYQQLLKTGRSRPETVGYPKLTTSFNQIIYNMKGGNVQQVLNASAITLQRELDALKKK